MHSIEESVAVAAYVLINFHSYLTCVTSFTFSDDTSSIVLLEIITIYFNPLCQYSARNKDQKLVGRFLKMDIFR